MSRPTFALDDAPEHTRYEIIVRFRGHDVLVSPLTGSACIGGMRYSATPEHGYYGEGETVHDAVRAAAQRESDVVHARGLTLEVRQVLRERANVYVRETRRGVEYCGAHVVGTWIVEVRS